VVYADGHRQLQNLPNIIRKREEVGKMSFLPLSSTSSDEHHYPPCLPFSSCSDACPPPMHPCPSMPMPPPLRPTLFYYVATPLPPLPSHAPLRGCAQATKSLPPTPLHRCPALHFILIHHVIRIGNIVLALVLISVWHDGNVSHQV